MEALRQRRQRAATTAQQGGVKLRSEREVVIVVGDVQATALCIEREFELAVSERLAIRLAEKWHGNAAIERGVDEAPVDVAEICMAAVADPFEPFEPARVVMATNCGMFEHEFEDHANALLATARDHGTTH